MVALFTGTCIILQWNWRRIETRWLYCVEYPQCSIRIEALFADFVKTTPYGKMFKILFWKFSSSHRSTCYVQIPWNLADECSKFCSESFHHLTDRRAMFKYREIWPTKNRRNCALRTSQKIWRGSCTECTLYMPRNDFELIPTVTSSSIVADKPALLAASLQTVKF